MPRRSRSPSLDATGLHGIFTDIDDTLTTGGKLHAAVYMALEQLRDAGFVIVPVTGRSAGWAHMVLHHWPVEAVVAESGGLCLYRDQAGIPTWLYHDDPARIVQDRITHRRRRRAGHGANSRLRAGRRQSFPAGGFRDRSLRDGAAGAP